MKYFHELTAEEILNLNHCGITWAELSELHPQPAWCQYPGALDGLMGCWSLIMNREKINEDFCQNCELYVSVIA